MKKPEEIKKGLEFGKENCLNAKCCVDECPYETCCDVSYPDVMAEVPRTMLCDALALIQQLESQVPRWISVEERLPERHGQQCVGLYSIGEYKGYLTPYVFTWHAYGNNGYVDGPHFNDEGLDGLKVHYWMPLPEAPKEDAHENS